MGLHACDHEPDFQNKYYTKIICDPLIRTVPISGEKVSASKLIHSVPD